MCLCPVALSCSHCDVVNQTLQIRCIGCQSAVALSSPMLKITTDVLMSDIIIGLTLICFIISACLFDLYTRVIGSKAWQFSLNVV